MANEKNFAVSVATAIGRDPKTKAGIFLGQTNASTAVTLGMTATDIRGGIGNVLQGKYMHDKSLSVNITKVTFGKSFLPLNTGSSLQNKQSLVVKNECATLDENGSATLSSIPTGNVSVFLAEDIVTTIQPSNKTITIPAYAGQKVNCLYDAMETIDLVTIETSTPPKVIDLTLIWEVRDNDMALVEYVQVNIPKFQVDGNYELSLSADGTSNETLTGSALSVPSPDCTAGDMYATVGYIPVLNTGVSVNALLIGNGDIEITKQTQDVTIPLSAIGLRGGMAGNIELTTQSTFALDTEPTPPTGVSINGNIVTITSTATAGVCYVTASYKVSDTVTLTGSAKITVKD